jgi:hypothetical protein
MARTKQSARLSSPTPTPNTQPLDPLPQNTQYILRQGAEAVAYHIPSSPSTSVLKTIILLPRYSKWTSGLHFHTRHTEYLRLVRGAIYVHLDGQEKILSAEAGGEISISNGELKAEGLVIQVPRYARHEWKRAEAWYGEQHHIGAKLEKPVDVDEEVVVEEWTDPSDLGKPLFFWNLNGVITSPKDDHVLPLPQKIVKGVLKNFWIPFQLFVIFWDLDNWPVFFSLRGTLGPQLGLKPWVYRYVEGPLEYVMTLSVLLSAKVLGWLIGVRAVEHKWTPEKLWISYRRNGI